MKRSEFNREINSGRNKKSGILFLFVMLLIFVGVGIWLALSLRTDPVSENLKSDRVVKTLFVMEDKGNVLFTDVFIYYPMAKRGALINILGNTGAIYRSLNRVDRIDAIYSEKGVEVYKSEIENLIGQQIPFYVVLRLEDFDELTDLLGGMKVFIPIPIDSKTDAESDANGEQKVESSASESGEPMAKKRWLLPNGVVNLDGDKVIDYLTYSKKEDDEDLIERRQNVMVSFFTALSRNQRLLKNKKTFGTVSEKFDSNLKANDLYRLMNEISQVDSERLVPQAITGMTRTVDGKKLLFPFYDGELIKDVVMQASNALVSSDGADVNRVYVLEIKNGTATQGLARNTAVLMRSAGYDVLSMTNADTQDYEKTVIINHIGNEEVAKNLGDFIHCTNIVDEDLNPDTDANVDFTLILGRDFDGRYVR